MAEITTLEQLAIAWNALPRNEDVSYQAYAHPNMGGRMKKTAATIADIHADPKVGPKILQNTEYLRLENILLNPPANANWKKEEIDEIGLDNHHHFHQTAREHTYVITVAVKAQNNSGVMFHEFSISQKE